MYSMNIFIEKISEKDLEKAADLIEKVVKNSFLSEGLTGKKYQKMMLSDLKKQKKRLMGSLRENADNKFLLAKEGENIVGTIGYNLIGKEVTKALHILKLDTKSIVEIISLYIDPSMQRKNVGTLLFSQLIKILQKKKVEYFALCSGYQKGIAFWRKKLGKETAVLKGYYDGHDCYVWIRKMSSIGS